MQQQSELHFQFGHGQLCVQGLQALPDHAQPIEPEHRTGQADLKIKQQIGVMALAEAVLIALALVASQWAQRRDPLTIGIGIIDEHQPRQGSAQAQGTRVGCILTQPPGT